MAMQGSRMAIVSPDSVRDLSQLTSHHAVDIKTPSADDEWHFPFSESTYTFLYMCGPRSPAFWYAVFVYFIQVVTILLTLIDTIDWDSDENRIGLPPMVSLTVTLTQGVAIFIMLAFQSDLIEAVAKLHDGFYPEVEVLHTGATYCSWLTSCIAQLLAGLLLLVTIFILTMQVDDVLSIMLNFAALHFMAEIDDLGFRLAKLGFVAKTLQDEANAVADFKIPKRAQVGRKRNILRKSLSFGNILKVPKRDEGGILLRILYLITVLCLFIGYGILKEQQLDGKYLETYLFVQFGDSYNPMLQYYSGIFQSTDGRTTMRRNYRDMTTNHIALAYCNHEKAWTFSESDEPCDYFAKSPKTSTYDVTTIDNGDWEVKDTLSNLQPFDSFSIIGHECDEDLCRGKCVDGLCVCPGNLFGSNCEFGDICPELVLDGNFEPFPAFQRNVLGIKFKVGASFRPLHDERGVLVKVHSMPVYYSSTAFPSTFIFFGGRRWVMTDDSSHVAESECDGIFGLTCLQSLQERSFLNETAKVLQTESFRGSFHGATFVFEPLFLSDPVDFQTPDFQPTPAGLGWSQAAKHDEKNGIIGVGKPVDTVLSCLFCLPVYGGHCGSGSCNMTSGLCDCLEGFSGAKCEIEQSCYDQEWPCSGSGLCDPWVGQCRCFNPHHGRLCDQVYGCDEEKGKCLNGGTCNNWNQRDCPDPATSGLSCEQHNDCSVFGCKNGGVCNEDTRACDCPVPYHGLGCDLVNSTLLQDPLCLSDDDCFDGTCNPTTGACEDRYRCTQSGCRNNGVCYNETDYCVCQGPFTGLDCSEVPDCMEDSDCVGKGKCLIQLF